MGIPYKLMRRRGPQQPEESTKWYAVPKTGKAMKETAMSRAATEDTTIADFELTSAAKLIGKFIHNQVTQGKRVRIPGLGSFRISFGSEGVDDIQKFHTGLIRNVKVVFTIDNELRSDILRDLTFENAGVEEDGVYYGTLDNYKEVKGLKTPSGGGSQTDPSGGDDSGKEEL